MSYAYTHSAQVDNLSGSIVTVEVDISVGLNHFAIVGLGDRAVDEARDRVSSALKNTGQTSPKTKNQKTIISLSPAAMKKEGSHFDLAIAVAYLMAEGVISQEARQCVFIGELGLDGSVRPVKSSLTLALGIKSAGFSLLFIAEDNAPEASIASGIQLYPVKNLMQIIQHFTQNNSAASKKIRPYVREIQNTKTICANVDFSEIAGQEGAKRALIIAACGGHVILLYGPPGTGKTMLARALAGILPELPDENMIEVANIHSLSGITTLPEGRPFRSPHHSASYASIIGGGSPLRPGEISLAHSGVLFLDEFPEFDRRVIESLRQPLEERSITLTRTKQSITLPAQFLCVLTMNPCPCGYKGSHAKKCICTNQDILRYKKKLSGPILDRIDIAVCVGEIQYDTLSKKEGSKTSESIRAEIQKTQQYMFARNSVLAVGQKENGVLSARELSVVLNIRPDALKILEEGGKKLGLSIRAFHRTQKLARTIADIEASEFVECRHILEALAYRPSSILPYI